MKKIFKGINVLGTIILTLVCSFFISIFVQPVIDVAKNFSGSIFSFFIDLSYRLAATTTENLILNIFSMNILTVCIFYFFTRQLSIIKDTVSNFCNQISDTENIEEFKEKNQSKIKRLRWCSMAFLITCGFFTLTYFYFPFSIKTSFDISITKISPYTDTNKLDVLKSDWMCMKSKDDFYNIKNQIDWIIEQHNLK